MQQLEEHRRRAAWLKTLHQWHWISAAICLVGMLLFSLTGITLNHASWFDARPRVSSHDGILPDSLQVTLAEAMRQARPTTQPSYQAPLPAAVSEWLQQQWQVSTAGKKAEWSADEIYLSMPRPGGDAWLRIDPESGEIEYELTDNGWISYVNDLHKGRHTGAAWRWFIDLVAIACLIFSITGLWIMKLHAANRPSTWPLVGFGLLLPVLLMLLFIH
ncbi:MAG: PepSY-associated TM helix domain-containing protein [Lautropia sp.]|nr:PepSY-associated TM helix domain-containing protein [Lautropia sp.]